MRRDVTTINTGIYIRRKSDKGAVSGRSVSHQCVGFYQYTETLGYGDGKLPRLCRCVKKKKRRERVIFSSCAARSAIINLRFVEKGMPLQVSLKRCNMGGRGGGGGGLN